MAWYTSDKSGQVEGVASVTIIVTEGRDRVEIGGGQLKGKKWERGANISLQQSPRNRGL